MRCEGLDLSCLCTVIGVILRNEEDCNSGVWIKSVQREAKVVSIIIQCEMCTINDLASLTGTVKCYNSLLIPVLHPQVSHTSVPISTS